VGGIGELEVFSRGGVPVGLDEGGGGAGVRGVEPEVEVAGSGVEVVDDFGEEGGLGGIRVKVGEDGVEGYGVEGVGDGEAHGDRGRNFEWLTLNIKH
jgi:hypothetical protein